MNLAILRKTLRDALWLLLPAMVGLCAFEVLFVYVIGNLAEDLLGFWRQLPFIARLLNVLLGLDVSGEIGLTSFYAAAFVHPIVLIGLCAVLVTLTTRATVGEVDRGTADLLLTLPVTRLTVYVQTSVAWLLAGAGLSLVVWLGVALGVLLFPRELDGPPNTFALVTINLFALYCAVGGSAMMASTWTTRRGVAVAWILAALLLSFLISFFEALWPPMARVGWLGFLHWYRPVEIVAAAAMPTGALLVLLVIAVVTWVAGAVRYTRMDVPAA